MILMPEQEEIVSSVAFIGVGDTVPQTAGCNGIIFFLRALECFSVLDLL